MTTKNDKLTPAMKQFRHFKEKYPDAILFFRMGDFYETFYEDAQICSRVCGIVLTSRSKGDNPIPLAGVPYHAVDGYLKKMLQAGYKVAVCEQVEDAKLAKGPVERDVVRIVTPGTLTDDILLNEKQDNFLCAVHLTISSLSTSLKKSCSTNCSCSHPLNAFCRIREANFSTPRQRNLKSKSPN
jgi:DNA mismatch repair protein MutS